MSMIQRRMRKWVTVGRSCNPHVSSALVCIKLSLTGSGCTYSSTFAYLTSWTALLALILSCSSLRTQGGDRQAVDNKGAERNLKQGQELSTPLAVNLFALNKAR